MALQYFQKFPGILYDIKNNKDENLVTNILHKSRVRKIVRDNAAVVYSYVIKDGETPEILAHKYYGNSQLHWLILIPNNILNVYYDWPMNYNDFNNTMISMFGDIRNSKLALHHYEDAFGNTIDKTTYDALPSNERSSISAYDYYFGLNENKRNIVLIDKIYADRIDNELTKLLSDVHQ